MAKAKQNMKITGKGTGNAFLRGFIKTLHLLSIPILHVIFILY